MNAETSEMVELTIDGYFMGVFLNRKACKEWVLRTFGKLVPHQISPFGTHVKVKYSEIDMPVSGQ